MEIIETFIYCITKYVLIYETDSQVLLMVTK